MASAAAVAEEPSSRRREEATAAAAAAAVRCSRWKREALQESTGKFATQTHCCCRRGGLLVLVLVLVLVLLAPSGSNTIPASSSSTSSVLHLPPLNPPLPPDCSSDDKPWPLARSTSAASEGRHASPPQPRSSVSTARGSCGSTVGFGCGGGAVEEEEEEEVGNCGGGGGFHHHRKVDDISSLLEAVGGFRFEDVLESIGIFYLHEPAATNRPCGPIPGTVPTWVDETMNQCINE